MKQKSESKSSSAGRSDEFKVINAIVRLPVSNGNAGLLEKSHGFPNPQSFYLLVKCTLRSGMTFSFSKKLPYDPDKTYAMLMSALKVKNFTVLSYIDMKEIVEQKLKIPFKNYLILNVCRPDAAKELMDENPEMGMFLPCKILISPVDGGSTIEVLRISVLARDYLHIENSAAAKYEDELISVIAEIN